MTRYLICFLFCILASITIRAQEGVETPADSQKQENDTVQTIINNDTVKDFQDTYDNNRFKKRKTFLHNDTVWKDYAMGTRVHLQRLSNADTLVRTEKSLIKPVLESVAINFGVWGYDHFFKDEGWADVNAHTIHHNLKCKWILDHDSYSGNQFSHPFHGSMRSIPSSEAVSGNISARRTNPHTTTSFLRASEAVQSEK